ncbi:OmpA family protein, partial [Tianweitania sp.]|uniref:OmpA family protein n=1 Tax=Tianweitania sp. TaxID=2021634 RepID=UPI0028A25F27
PAGQPGAAPQPGPAAQPQQAQPAQPAQPAAPPPTSDAAAQSERSRPTDIRSAREERGQRIEVDRDQPRRWERRENVDVVKEVDNRIILNFGGQDFVESSDRDRMGRDSRDTYYEELPRGRTRETIVRQDGTQVVTIRNAYGDVVRRSRITPDNREYVLSYVDEDEYDRDRGREWRDPGEDLPPLVLTIPARDYILDAGTVDDEPERYYDFLDQPPVERIERLYSVEEVKRSARVRDTVRRVDLDTITFATGSAEVAESQVDRLEGVAQGMQKLLKRNPAETFLIEGHTDAVGSDQSNLVLSDRRAEAVADALSRYFDIPPENLTTQGYGERYLKIKTDGAEQENRRVAIRRITALVAPASASAK